LESGLGHEEGARDFRGRKSANRAQRERHLRFGGKCRMTTGEDQSQAVVGEHLRFLLACRSLNAGECLDLSALALERGAAAQPVERGVARRGRYPGGGPLGHAASCPAFDGDGEGVLERLLGEVEVAKETDQRSEDPPVFFAEHALDHLGARTHRAGLQGDLSMEILPRIS